MIGDFCFTEIGRSDIRDQTVRFLRVWLPKVSMVTFPTSPQNLKRSEGFRDPTFWVCIPTENVDFFFSFFPPFCFTGVFSLYSAKDTCVMFLTDILDPALLPQRVQGRWEGGEWHRWPPSYSTLLVVSLCQTRVMPSRLIFFVFVFLEGQWFSETYFPLVVV